MTWLMGCYERTALDMDYRAIFISEISSVSLFIKFEGTSLLAYVNETLCSHVNQEEIWRKLWKEMTSLFRVAGCTGLSYFVKGIKAILLGPFKKDRCTNVGNQDLLQKGTPLGAGEMRRQWENRKPVWNRSCCTVREGSTAVSCCPQTVHASCLLFRYIWVQWHIICLGVFLRRFLRKQVNTYVQCVWKRKLVKKRGNSLWRIKKCWWYKSRYFDLVKHALILQCWCLWVPSCPLSICYESWFHSLSPALTINLVRKVWYKIAQTDRV